MSGKWKLTEWKINGKVLWSEKAWLEIAPISKEIRIKVYHVDFHQNKDDLQTKYDNEADRLVSMTIKLKAHYQDEQTGPIQNLKVRGNGPKWLPTENQRL